jgi:hypothetical protein
MNCPYFLVEFIKLRMIPVWLNRFATIEKAIDRHRRDTAIPSQC